MPKGAEHAKPARRVNVRVFCLGCGQPVHIGAHRLRALGAILYEFVPAECPWCGKAFKSWGVDDVSVREHE